MSLLVVIAAAYLLGSIPFGLLLSRLAGLGDIRKVGSGNIGATNVLRTGRRDLAALTLLLDAAKGWAAVVAAAYWAGPDAALVAGVAAVLGHCTSPWVGFRGGKGVATGLGVVLAWSWPIALAVAALWLAIAYASRRSSLGSVIAVCATPALLYVWNGAHGVLAGVAVAAIILVRHEGNIRRLLAGTEPRIGQGR